MNKFMIILDNGEKYRYYTMYNKKKNSLEEIVKKCSRIAPGGIYGNAAGKDLKKEGFELLAIVDVDNWVTKPIIDVVYPEKVSPRVSDAMNTYGIYKKVGFIKKKMTYTNK